MDSNNSGQNNNGQVTLNDLKTSIDGLAVSVKKGFSEAEAKTDSKIEELAVMVQRGFDEMGEKINGRIDGVEKKMEKGFKELRQDMDTGFSEVKEEIKKLKEVDDTQNIQIKDVQKRVVVLEKKAGVEV